MDYVVKIDSFDGPLDLLLHLLKKSNIEICDIRIDEIAKQYLDYIYAMEELNLNIASEYLVMASELLEMKSRHLLPNRKIEDDEEIETREQFIQKLINYSHYKEVSQTFKKMEQERKKIYTKNPSFLEEYVIPSSIQDNVTLEDLLLAFQKFLIRKEGEKPLPTKVTMKEYSLYKRNTEIKNIVKKIGRISFSSLFDYYEKGYIIITFLSVLDLASRNEIKIKQDNHFEEIYLIDKGE